jgi:hypothetical protein
VYLLFFHAYEYINEMHGSRSKSPVKNLVRQRCAEGFNSGVKGLTRGDRKHKYMCYLAKSVSKTWDIHYRYPVPISSTDIQYRYPVPISSTDIQYQYPVSISSTDIQYQYPVPKRNAGDSRNVATVRHKKSLYSAH